MEPTPWTLSYRQLCDLELLLDGSFAPLTGFLERNAYETVLQDMRLPEGSLWPIPITLDVSRHYADTLSQGHILTLESQDHTPLARMVVRSIWEPDRLREAEYVFGTQDRSHPGVRHLLDTTGPVYVGGPVECLRFPTHYDFTHLRLRPHTLKGLFQKWGWTRVVAFQTRNPMHRAHYELTLKAMGDHKARLLLHPVIGSTKPGDVDPFTRVRCYKKILRHYEENQAALALLPLAMRMAGPREALWHALIRQNYGCTHFIVGRDHAGPGLNAEGQPFYGPYEAHDLLKRVQDHLAIHIIPLKEMVYVKERNAYLPRDEAHGPFSRLSGSELRSLLRQHLPIPSWFSYPEIVEELRHQRLGVTIFLTGLPASGKSTLALALEAYFLEQGLYQVTRLDGDVVRHHLSPELGFSKEHRALNVKRVGYMAREVTRHGGIALCALVAPYRSSREAVRALIHDEGLFLEVHVATPLAVCEERDPKGLYKRARAGHIKGVTGLDAPYEVPLSPHVSLDTSRLSLGACVQAIVSSLHEKGLPKRSQEPAPLP